MTNDKEKLYAYLAGFIDADGSITIVNAKYKDKKGITRIQYRIKLSAHNCKIQPIQVLQKEFGGGKLRNTRRGKIKLHPNWRSCYEWIITNHMAANAIKSMLPYLIVKKEQALLCLEMDRLKTETNAAIRRWNPELGKKITNQFIELKTKINVLNKRGQ
jgi:hypothetical protein